MVKVKMMNESNFEKLVNEFAALGELIRSRQDEKQSIADEFDKERVRFSQGKISKNTLVSSTKKTNVELMRLDKNIRVVIQKAKAFSKRSNDFIKKQNPIVFKAHESGIKLAKTKKKAVVKKLPVSKAQLSKEIMLDKKFSK